MQIKSNKEARNYQEQVYFGLTVRQLVFSGLAGAAALGVFFLAQGRLSMEMVSWLWLYSLARDVHGRDPTSVDPVESCAWKNRLFQAEQPI